MSRREVPEAPVFAELPPAVARRRRCGPARRTFEVHLRTVTPIMGGGAVPPRVDEVDVVRGPTIRGHLRFWWRVLHVGAVGSPAELYKAESALWGRAADEDGGRSPVEITVTGKHPTRADKTGFDASSPEAYAFWPVMRTNRKEEVPRRFPGLRFTLTVTAETEAQEQEVRDALRAWVLFGGYGSRTRRGAGSLTVTRDQDQWLPELDEESRAKTELPVALDRLFPCGNPFRLPAVVRPFPAVGGAALLVGAMERDGAVAWTTALGWLSRFRQGYDVGRDRGPGQSRWPEADKLRHRGVRDGHATRYSAEPIWPRAVFGLPIVGQFKGGTPRDFTITWQGIDPKGKRVAMDRMASPVIVKALPCTGGFLPALIWLSRTMPPGQVGVVDPDVKSPRVIRAGSTAPFSETLSAADQATASALKAPLTGTATVRHAFLAWVLKQQGVVKVFG